MARLLLWNSVATRRRASSDTFLENGLGGLAAHARALGHEVAVEDWATDEAFAALASPALARPLRAAYARLLDGTAGPARAPLAALTLGLQAAQSALQRRRMEARIEALARRVAAERVDVLGVKLWYGEAFGWARRLAEAVHAASPATLVVAGGYHATLYEEYVLAAAPFDLAVRGDGEDPLAEILDASDAARGAGRDAVVAAVAARNVPGVLWRVGDFVERAPRAATRIGGRALPAYGAGRGKVRIHVVQESAGCPWGRCHFCVHPTFHPQYLPRRVDEVVAEIRAMVEQDVGIFRFAGSDTPPAFGARIARGLRDAGLDVRFGMSSRAVRGCARPEAFARTVGHLEDLLRGGLRALFVGGETGHDRVNDEVMNKGVTRADLVATARAVREAERRTGLRLDLVLALIHPTPLVPGVSHEDVFAADLALVREMRPDSVMVTPPGPFKGTRWHAEAERFGFDLDAGFVRTMLEYEYVIYKPPRLWPRLAVGLGGRDFVEVLSDTGRLRAAVEALGIPTDLSDEHLLMARAAGFEGEEGARRFKRETLLDILSCDGRALAAIAARVDAESRRLAARSRGPGKAAARPPGRAFPPAAS